MDCPSDPYTAPIAKRGPPLLWSAAFRLFERTMKATLPRSPNRFPFDEEAADFLDIRH
jgi:hypothetical protein